MIYSLSTFFSGAASIAFVNVVGRILIEGGRRDGVTIGVRVEGDNDADHDGNTYKAQRGR